MATYDYQCQACGLVHEHIQSVKLDLPEALPCPRCGKDSEHVILVAPAVSTRNMSNMTQDVAIGKDADNRWERILAKREVRNKIRRETGASNLTATAVGEFGAKDFKPSNKKLEFVHTPEPRQG